MQQLRSLLNAATPELLLFLVAAGIYLVGLFLGRLCKRRLNIRLGWTYQVFILAVAIGSAAAIFHLQVPGARALGLIAVFTAAFPLNALLDRFLWPLYGYPGERARIPSFLPQIVAIIVTITALFVALGVFYQVTVPSLLASSGLIAIVIGLALQDTLGNIFAGLGLQAGKAYRVGDWLIVDGKHLEVVEINWRSTRLRNNDAVTFDIPNNQLAKATIVNLYQPTRVHAMRVNVSIPYTVPPNRVKEALVKAASSAAGVLAKPAPYVFLMSFDDSGISYQLKFWLDDGTRFPQIIDRVRTNVWYELNRQQIDFSFPVRLVEMTTPAGARKEVAVATNLLLGQPLFAGMQAEELQELGQSAIHLRFGKGEKIVEQGKAGKSMYILSDGSAEVRVERDGEFVRVGRLGQGDCFGEISLLTGEPRTATVIAECDCEVVKIEKSAMRTLLVQHPRLAETLSETLAARRLVLEAEINAVRTNQAIAPIAVTKESFLARLRQFFEL
jgi:small-conductance mechanosensitive channel/CRP-like cAMP-binding protein